MKDQERLIKRDIAELRAKKLNAQDDIKTKTHEMIGYGTLILKRQSELKKLQRRSEKVAK